MRQYQPASDQALLITLPHAEVIHVLHALEAAQLPAIENLHPGYNTLLIRFDQLSTSHAEMEELVETLLKSSTPAAAPARSIEIPACYSGAHAPDLSAVALHLNLSEDDVIRLHTGTVYTVFFLGFVPGFAYLGELPPPLHIQRLATPRTRVPPGSVAIANAQTGVYPFPTPGGWRLIGRTPLKIFDPARPTMSLLEIGQQVRFTRISEAEYDAYA